MPEARPPIILDTTTSPATLREMEPDETVPPENSLPAGGVAGDVLTKGSGVAGDVAWAAPAVTQAELDAEASTRASADSAEATARANADTAIQAELDAHEGAGGAAHADATETADGFATTADRVALTDLVRVRELLAQAAAPVDPDSDTAPEVVWVIGQNRWRAGTDTTGFVGAYFYAEIPASFAGTYPNAFASTSNVALYSPIGVPNTGSPNSNAPAITETPIQASMYWDDGVPLFPGALTGGALLEIDLLGALKVGRTGTLYLVIDPDGDVQREYGGDNTTTAFERNKCIGAEAGVRTHTAGTIVRDTDDNIKINLPVHGLVDDDRVFLSTADRTLGVMPNLIDSGWYYVDRIDADNFKPSTTPVAGANYVWWYPTPTQSTAVLVAGVSGYEVDRDASGDVIISKPGHGLTPGALYQITSAGTIVPNLVSGNSYYVDVLDADTFKPSTTAGPGWTYVNWAPTPAESDELVVTRYAGHGSWKAVKFAFDLATVTSNSDFVPVRIRIIGAADGRGSGDTEDGVIWYAEMHTFEVCDQVGSTTTTVVASEGVTGAKSWRAAAPRTSPGKGFSNTGAIRATAAPLLFATTDYNGSGTDAFITTAHDYGGQWDEICTSADLTASVPFVCVTSSVNNVQATTTLLSVGGVICGEVLEVLNGRRIVRYRPFQESVRIKSGDTVSYQIYKRAADGTWSAVGGASGSFTAGAIRIGPHSTQLALRAAMSGAQDGVNVLDIRSGVARLNRNRKR